MSPFNHNVQGDSLIEAIVKPDPKIKPRIFYRVAFCLQVVALAGLTQITIIDSAMAGSDTESSVAETKRQIPSHKAKKVSFQKNRKILPASEIQANTETLSPKLSSDNDVRRFDKLLGYKGWDTPFPSFSDTILQDVGGWRSTLAKYGLGFLEYNLQIFSVNTLPVATYGTGPSNAPLPGRSDQQYLGQRPSLYSRSLAFLTYDTSQFGIPDGQIAVEGGKAFTSYEQYAPSQLALVGLSWYQTLFNKALEIKFGLIGGSTEFAGNLVGGNVANPLGPSATIPFAMGLSTPTSAQPMVRTTWHITDTVYNESAVMRSTPINGPTGNTFYDNWQSNPSNTRFSIPNARELFIDEFGYKNNAGTNLPFTWLRFGAELNTSKFANYQNGGTTTGNTAMYFLGDRQIYQIAPQSDTTAYRGFYLGASAMYSPPAELPVSQYYEFRAYAIGPFDARPRDLIAFVYYHNVYSNYLANSVNATAYKTGLFAHNFNNTASVTYTARLIPGVYWTVGAAYTDNPSITYTKHTGSALNFNSTLFTAF